jgi:hypothetical protein
MFTADTVNAEKLNELQRMFERALSSAFSSGGTSAIQTKVANAWLKDMREGFMSEWGYDPDEVWNHSDEPGFSLGTVRESIRRSTMREAVTEMQFAALTRYGVVKELVGGYNLAPTVYKQAARIVNSGTSEENYAPTYGSDIPDVVEDGEEAGESRMAGFTLRIRNERYAKVLAISKTLFQDDQTGQLKLESSVFGKRMAHAEEKAVMQNFFAFGTTANTGNAGGQVPATNIAGTAVGQGLVTTTLGQINQQRLEDGWTAAAYVTDPLGNLIVVEWDALIIAKVDEILTRKLLQSMYSPSVPGATGTVGYFMTENILKGMFQILATPFISTLAGVRAGLAGGAAPWALIEKNSKAMIFQNRTALQVIQEVANAGKSFDRNEVRLLTERRFGTNPVDGRFAFWGN